MSKGSVFTNKIDNRPIAVFDSGIGGLTVLDNIIKEFPNEEYYYLGDTLNCPYGLKTTEQIKQFVHDAIKFVEKMNCKMMVIGCNTATFNSYHIESDIPIIRIIEPTANEALQKHGNKNEEEKIIVLGTNLTIDHGAYERFLGEKMIGVRASKFVEIAENGLQDSHHSKRVCEKILKHVKGKGNIVILGCTHFGLLENDIKHVLGHDIEIIESSKCIINNVRKTLKEIGVNDNSNPEKIKISINVTGNPEEVKIDWFQWDFKGINKVYLESAEN